MNTISIQDFKTADPGFILDVRTPVEYAGVHIKNAINLPLNTLNAQEFVTWAKTNGWQDEQAIYIVCKSGKRAGMAATKLAELGLNLQVVEGGTDACVAAGMAVAQDNTTQAVSLERQVRIMAGSLVLLGVILGWLVNPAFFALSGFVGAGLVFAGITDSCAMGMLLAKMPWNQHAGSYCPSSKA